MLRKASLALLIALLPLPGATESRDGEDEDVVSIVPLERRVLAVNPVTGPVAEVELDLNEVLVASRTRGRLGVAVTNRRLLGITSRSAVWSELRLRVSEAGPESLLVVEERVALVQLRSRLAAISAASPAWQHVELASDERVHEAFGAERVVAVVTDRRAIAFSARSGFVAEPLSPTERIERSSADARSIQLVTTSRVLVFQEGARRWTWVRD